MSSEGHSTVSHVPPILLVVLLNLGLFYPSVLLGKGEPSAGEFLPLDDLPTFC